MMHGRRDYAVLKSVDVKLIAFEITDGADDSYYDKVNYSILNCLDNTT